MKRKRRAGPGILLFFFLTAAAALPAYGAAGAEEGAAVKTGAGYAGEEASARGRADAGDRRFPDV